MALTNTTLAEAVDADTLTFTVVSAAGADLGGFIRVDDEYSFITGILGKNIAVRSRGSFGGLAVDHLAGAPVVFGLAADVPDGGGTGITGSFNPVASMTVIDGRVTEATEGPVGGFLDTSEKGQPNGVATLDGSGKVPASELPPLEHDVGEAATQAAMLALPVSAPAIAIRTDFSPPHVFFLTADPATTLGNWVDTGEFGAGGAAPTAQVSLSATPGVANTFMRSDAAPVLSQGIAPAWTGAHSHTQPVRFIAGKNYEVLAGNIATDDRLILRATSALAARFWFDSFSGSTGLSFAEAGVERVYFGTALGGGAVLDTKTYAFKLKTNTATNFAALDTSLLTADRILQFPDAAGVLALRSDFASGTYAPTVSPGTNISSATANGTFIYTKVGTSVQVAGSMDVTATATGAAVITITMPVPVTFADTHKLSGSGAATNGSVMSPAYVRSTAAAQTATIDWIAPNTNLNTLRFTLMYTTA